MSSYQFLNPDLALFIAFASIPGDGQADVPFSRLPNNIVNPTLCELVGLTDEGFAGDTSNTSLSPQDAKTINNLFRTLVLQPRFLKKPIIEESHCWQHVQRFEKDFKVFKKFSAFLWRGSNVHSVAGTLESLFREIWDQGPLFDKALRLVSRDLDFLSHSSRRQARVRYVAIATLLGAGRFIERTESSYNIHPELARAIAGLYRKFYNDESNRARRLSPAIVHGRHGGGNTKRQTVTARSDSRASVRKTGAVTSSPAAGSPKRRVRERPRLTAVSPEVNKVGQTATYEDYLGPVIPDEDNHATEKLPLEAQLLLERERLSNAENWSRCQVKLILNLAKDLL